MTNQKGVASLVIIILVILGIFVVGYYIYQQQQQNKTPLSLQDLNPQVDTETTNTNQDLKTYTSKEYLFSLKYPSTWETYVYGKKPTDEPVEVFSERFFRPINQEAPSVILNINKGGDFQLSSEAIKSYSWDNKTVTETTVDHITAIKVTGTSNGKENSAIVFKRFDNVFQLQGDNILIFDQIINSWKFNNIEVGLGEICSGRSPRVCADGLTCQQESQSADSAGVCVKE